MLSLPRIMEPLGVYTRCRVQSDQILHLRAQNDNDRSAQLVLFDISIPEHRIFGGLGVCAPSPPLAWRLRRPYLSLAARFTDSMIRPYALHRHRLPTSASLISSSEGLTLALSSAVALITKPGVQ